LITENLSTLKIHQLTQEQYEREKEAGRIDSTALYLTPEKKIAGIVHQYAGFSAPYGYLLCDGSFYRTDEYPELFDAIGFTYGESGSGVNLMFAVPNLATRVPVGVGTGYALGATGGEAKHTLTVNEMPSHNHNNSVALETTGSTTLQNSAIMYRNQKQTTSFLGNLATAATGSGAAHNNMQPYIALNYIISTGK
jgi:microcystin-dependent protein